tara:strand:- start:1882 stop:2046 length:165 start_codon:yes stop_codon:yes gene_type:complete
MKLKKIKVDIDMYSLLLCINVYTGKTFAAQGCFPFVRWKSPVFLKIFFIKKLGR